MLSVGELPDTAARPGSGLGQRRQLREAAAARSCSCFFTLSGSLFGLTPGGRIFWRSFGSTCGVCGAACCCGGAGAVVAERRAALACGASAGLQIEGACEPSGQTLGS